MSDSVPVTSTDDILSAFPQFVQTDDPAIVRDAILAAYLAMFQEYQRRTSYAAAQSDPERAETIYLRGIAEDHQIYAQPGESDDALRARIFAAPGLVSPSVIIAAVNSIVGPFSDIPSQVFESDLDCAFITDGTAVYDSAFVGANPRYLSRLYADDAVENGGYVRAQSEPGGLWVFADQNGRHFIIRLPVLDAVDNDFAWAIDTDLSEMFISDGTDAFGSETNGTLITFAFQGGVTADDLYNAVVGTVDRIKPQGYRFTVLVDPSLSI